MLRDFKNFTAKALIEAIKEETESRKEWMLWLMARAAEKNKKNENYQFWRQDNHAEELITRPFMRQKLDYLHNNPVSAGWVDAPEDYPYSSARDYFGTRKGALEVMMLDC